MPHAPPSPSDARTEPWLGIMKGGSASNAEIELPHPPPPSIKLLVEGYWTKFARRSTHEPSRTAYYQITDDAEPHETVGFGD